MNKKDKSDSIAELDMELYVLSKDALGKLFDNLKSLGYEVIAHELDNGVLRFRALGSFDEVALNVISLQSPGHYRTEPNRLLFSYTHGPDSPKGFLYPPRRFLYQIVQEEDKLRTVCPQHSERKTALFGIKSCDVASIKVLDKTLLAGQYADPEYVRMRKNLAIIVVNCTKPSGTCFCASMGTGPRATDGFDLALTELDDKFVLEVATKSGESIVEGIKKRKASAIDAAEMDKSLDEARRKMGRELEVTGIKDKLYDRVESSAYQEIAKRCLSCGNCTSVCPTCFCNIVTDTPSLDGNTARRDVLWDSCFTYQFAQVAGGHFRPEIWARYRQWMVHKFAYWQDQFDTFGCVGCGRCISWCPVGIDITESLSEVLQVS